MSTYPRCTDMAFYGLWTVLLLAGVSAIRPHIVVIFIDDLGWNDVSFHGSPQIPTPNIDALACDGVILNQYYVQSLCSPSRTAFLTSKFPMRFDRGFTPFEASGLPLHLDTLADHLKRLGYSTHMTGKWHLGFHKKEFTPTFRGFDSFLGYWNAYTDYYDHTSYWTRDNLTFWGLDLHDGLRPVRGRQGYYSTHMYTDRAAQVIRNHDKSKPLFLFLAHQAVHAGLPHKPLQVPPRYVKPFSYIENLDRRLLAGMMSAADESVGRVFQALHDSRMLDNTILIFSTDNGGPNNIPASNWPLRGYKNTLWEGGIRGAGVLWSPLLKDRRPRVSNELMHLVDWLPTLYHAAGGDLSDLEKIDGIDMWPSLSRNLPSPRRELLLDLDSVSHNVAYRLGPFKLLQLSGERNGWYGMSGRTELGTSATDKWVFANGSFVGSILRKMGRPFPPTSDRWRREAEVRCEPVPGNAVPSCNISSSPCLFNIAEDACEYHNIADRHPKVVAGIQAKINSFLKQEVLTTERQIFPQADPSYYHFTYVPWMDEYDLQTTDYFPYFNV